MYARFLEIKKQMDELDKELDNIKIAIYNKAVFGEKSSTTFSDSGYKVRVQQKETTTVDQEKAKEYPQFFKTKYEFSKTIVDKLQNSDKDIVNKIITTKVGKPQFAVEQQGDDDV